MRIDFINEQAIIETALSFKQMGQLQKALQELYQVVVTDPAGTNTASAIESLEDMAAKFGVDIETACESIENDHGQV
jgi:accessory colonization factor AcfC